MEDLLKKSGYSERAIEYYRYRVHVGKIDNPTVVLSYKGDCGDTLRIYLMIDSISIKDASFEAIGCAGIFSAASALMEMVMGKTIDQAREINEEDIINHLGGIPENKRDCVHLARMTLEKTLELLKTKNNQ